MTSRTLPLIILLVACGPTSGGSPDSGITTDGPTGDCQGSETRCIGPLFLRCQDGSWRDIEQCSGDQVCTQALGCAECDPDRPAYCVGDSVHACNEDGSRGDHVADCAFEACYDGVCRDECGEAAQSHSYMGCEYWPVDLDNNIDLWGEPIPVVGDECSVYASTLSTVTWTIEAFNVCSRRRSRTGRRFRPARSRVRRRRTPRWSR